MSSRGRGRGRGGRGFRRGVHKVMHGELRVRDFGRKYTPTPFPKSIVQAPWNDLIWTISITEDTIFTVGQIGLGVLLTLGISSSETMKGLVEGKKAFITMRFIKAEAWEMEGGAIMMIARSMIDSSNGKEELTAVENLAGRASYARVGYSWPVSHQMVTFHSDDDSDKKVCSLHFEQEKGKKGKAEFRIHLLWKGTSRQYPQFGISVNSFDDKFGDLQIV